MISVSEVVLDYLTGVSVDRGDSHRRRDGIFDRAFELAYKDMATHTVAYSQKVKAYFDNDSEYCVKNRKEVKEALKEHIKGKSPLWKFGGFSKLLQVKTEEEFKKWHRETCENIMKTDEFGIFVELKDKEGNFSKFAYANVICHVDKKIRGVFTCGQAQKLVNMMCKYLYIFAKCEGSNRLDEFEKWFHAPIDSKVLKAALKTNKYENTPWSKILVYEDYEKCQKLIKEGVMNNDKYSKFRNSSMFMWELSQWHNLD